MSEQLQQAKQDPAFAAILTDYIRDCSPLSRAALSDRLEELGLTQLREEILGQCDMLSCLGFDPDAWVS